MDEVVGQLKALFARMNISRATLLEFVSSALEIDQGQMGYAFLKHAQDIIRETPDISESDLLCECYRRTFFDSGYAASYGTEDLLLKSPKQAMDMVEHLALRHDCDQRGAAVHGQAAQVQ